MRRPYLSLLTLIALTLSPLAHAGRPLSTDDAGTVGHLHYQVEGWHESTDTQHSTVLAPAVGLGEVEVGFEFGKTRAPEGLRIRDQALALKWAPEALSVGPMRFAAKAWHAQGNRTVMS